MYKEILSASLFGMVVSFPIMAVAEDNYDYLADDYINISTQVVTQDLINPVPVYHQYYYQRTYGPDYGFYYPRATQPVVVINRFNGPYYYSPCPGPAYYQVIPRIGVYNGPSTDNNYCW